MSSSVYTTYDYNMFAVSGIGVAVIIFMSLISIVVSIIMMVSLWKIFTKNGKPGWACLVPLYNFYVMCQIADKQWWYILLLFIPIVNIYAMYVLFNGLAQKSGKKTGFVIGMMLVPVVFFPILAFSKNDSIEAQTSQSTPLQDNLSNISNVNDSLVTPQPLTNEPQLQMSNFAVENQIPTTPVMQNSVEPAPIMPQPTQAADNFTAQVVTPQVTMPEFNQDTTMQAEQVVQPASSAPEFVQNAAPQVPLQEVTSQPDFIQQAPIAPTQPVMNQMPEADTVIETNFIQQDSAPATPIVQPSNDEQASSTTDESKPKTSYFTQHEAVSSQPQSVQQVSTDTSQDVETMDLNNEQ